MKLVLRSFVFYLLPAPERTRQQYREQKRSKDRLRSQEREHKQSTIENLSNLMSALTAVDSSDERCESLPPLSPAVKVFITKRYKGKNRILLRVSIEA